MERTPSLLPADQQESDHTLITQAAALPLADSHGWSSPPANAFFVRGPLYLDTKAKVPAGEPLLQPIAFHVLKSSSKISNIMNHPECRAHAALAAAKKSASSIDLDDDEDGAHVKPFVWVFNLQLPSKENLSLVMYYVSFQKPEQGSLMQRFLDGSDAFRSERLKLLANIPQGPRVVKLVVGEKGAVCMVGKLLNCSYIKGKDYMEVGVDIGSSMLATTAFQLSARLVAFATLDLAFVLEGRHRGELPEQVMGGMRLEKLDFSRALLLNKHTDDCEKEDEHTASYKRLWRSLNRAGRAGHGGSTANGVQAKV